MPLTDDDFASPDAAIAAGGGIRSGGSGGSYGISRRCGLRGARWRRRWRERLEERETHWHRVRKAMDWWQENCEVLLVEGRGWYVPVDSHDYMIADLAAALRLPVLVVTHAKLGAINETLLTSRSVSIHRLSGAPTG